MLSTVSFLTAQRINDSFFSMNGRICFNSRRSKTFDSDTLLRFIRVGGKLCFVLFHFLASYFVARKMQAFLPAPLSGGLFASTGDGLLPSSPNCPNDEKMQKYLCLMLMRKDLRKGSKISEG